ncbi:MAG: hypothetical protein ACI9GW_000870 [Halieaceae bacterium]|jgi:hypothetical protein
MSCGEMDCAETGNSLLTVGMAEEIKRSVSKRFKKPYWSEKAELALQWVLTS